MNPKEITLDIKKKAVDPVRFPSVIIPLENEAKLTYIKGVSNMRVELLNEMKNIISSNK